jgi:hypothetical protein
MEKELSLAPSPQEASQLGDAAHERRMEQSAEYSRVTLNICSAERRAGYFAYSCPQIVVEEYLNIVNTTGTPTSTYMLICTFALTSINGTRSTSLCTSWSDLRSCALLSMVSVAQESEGVGGNREDANVI